MLRLRGLYAKISPFNAGGSLAVRLVQGANSVVIAQTSIGATLANFPFAMDLQLSYDRRWAFPSGTNNVNVFGQASMTAATYSVQTVLANSAPVANSPRAQGPIAFASYSTSPTVETVLIDFDQDVTLTVTIGIGANDSAELLFCTLETVAGSAVGINNSNAKATIFAGNSLTEGTGSTANNDMVSMVGKARPGRGVLNAGLGGQTLSQIVDRMVKDPVAGKSWDMVLWGGHIEGSTDAAAWFATIQAQIARLQAFRGAGTKMMILNLHPDSAWAAGIK